MHRPLLEVIDTGLGVSFQDSGRRGWKRYGVPPGGALDRHAAYWANQLLGNAENCSVLEILLNGARFRALEPLEFALTGAATSAPDQRWQTRVLDKDEILTIRPPVGGVWSYLAIRGGFLAPLWFGSVSIFPRGGLGAPIERGHLLYGACPNSPTHSGSSGARWVTETERRRYSEPPTLQVWPGPQWESFPPTARDAFFAHAWQISPKSDRTGYRLEGTSLTLSLPSLPSEPVLPGSVQVPPDGLPIITLHDGPTVGGYSKLGLVDPTDLSRLTQCRPGTRVRFVARHASQEPSSRDRDQL